MNRAGVLEEEVTARERVDRKKAMVSISKPTRRRARRVRKYSHITPVSSRKVSGIITVAFSPSLMVSWSAVRAWNTVRSSSTVSTPPMPTTSPYWTGAEPSTGLPFTVTPPLEPRS